MSDLNFDVCLKHFYNILAEIQTFKLKAAFLVEAKNRLKWSINLNYGILTRKKYLKFKRPFSIFKRP